ncbi:MAG: hypothetical protein M1821_000931 [Bathelium mastoideum]|nr:MAG: hypothetical protein M1821_000931 [Bathelium mastoideum]
MKSVTVPDGTYQGQEVLIMKPAPPFPFLKLPVEIRLAIYGGVLGHEKRISIDSVNGGFYANKFHGKHRLAILSVNKQIQAEALPELYRGRTFCFGDPSSLAKFFHRSGVSAKRVEAIDLLWAFLTRRTMRRLSGGLAKCQILKRVRVSIGIDGDGEQPELEEMVAKGLRPWLLSGSKEKVINDEHLEATEIWYSNVDEEDEEVPGDFRARVLECL